MKNKKQPFIDLSFFYDNNKAKIHDDIFNVNALGVSEEEALKMVDDVFKDLEPDPEEVVYIQSYLAKKRAKKRHSEHRALKVDVFQWLDANWNKSGVSAEAVRGLIEAKIVPVAESTLNTWVTEYKKL